MGETLEMIQTQFSLPRVLVTQLQMRGHLRGKTVDEEVREALEQYLTTATYPLLTLANLGECDDDGISERAEEILADEIDPGAGWSIPC